MGTIGNEGMAGLSVILGVDSVPYRHIVQVAGTARRMSAAALVAELWPDRQLPQAAEPLSRRVQHAGHARHGLQRAALGRAALLPLAARRRKTASARSS